MKNKIFVHIEVSHLFASKMELLKKMELFKKMEKTEIFLDEYYFYIFSNLEGVFKRIFLFYEISNKTFIYDNPKYENNIEFKINIFSNQFKFIHDSENIKKSNVQQIIDVWKNKKFPMQLISKILNNRYPLKKWLPFLFQNFYEGLNHHNKLKFEKYQNKINAFLTNDSIKKRNEFAHGSKINIKSMILNRDRKLKQDKEIIEKIYEILDIFITQKFWLQNFDSFIL